MRTIKCSKINAIMLGAFFVRILMLILIVLLSRYMPAYGFYGNVVGFDDYRYEEGGVRYAQTADHVIDIPAFIESYAGLGDNTGYRMIANYLSSTPLWYWINCVLIYITKWRWSIRVLNILFITFSIKYIYHITCYVYGEKTASLSAKLMAFLPYPVIFPCFSYKDSMIMFCTFYLWFYFVKRKKERSSRRSELIKAFICAICVFRLRSGLSVLLVGTLFLYYYFDRIARRFISPKILVGLLVAAVCAVVLFLYFGDIIIEKFHYYVTSESMQENLSGGALLKISSLRDIWKLPFTLAFAVVHPFNFGAAPTSWANILSSLNVVMCPISVGWMLYFFEEKPDKACFWCMVGYYTITAIAAMPVSRYLFSLLPVPIMAFSNYWVRNKGKKKELWILGSAVMTFGVILIGLMK